MFFKAVFINHENILAKMVSDITGFDYDILENNISLEINELPIRRKDEKAKKCDFILRINKDNIINLELNLESYPGAIIKNLSYLFHLFSTSTKRSKKYNDNLIVMQVNLNCFKEKNGIKPLKKYSLREEDTNELYVKNVVIYDLNVVKCHQIYYNEDNKESLANYIKWGAFIYTKNIKNMPNILEGFLTKKEMDTIMAEVNKLTHNDLFYTQEEAEEWDEWERNSIRAYLEETIKKEVTEKIEKEVTEKAKYEVQEEKTKETIIAMNKNNIALEVISNVTGKTIEEIRDLIKENN